MDKNKIIPIDNINNNYFEDDNNIDKFLIDKDLLIVSLLEYMSIMCNSSVDIFTKICDHLKNVKIISGGEVYSTDKALVRQMYINFLASIYNNDNDYNDKNAKYLEIPLLDKDNKIIKYQKNISNYYQRYFRDFREIKILGNGGYGTVYHVSNKLDDNEYAIKKIMIEDINKSDVYLNEIRNLSKLEHKNIIRYYSSWLEGNTLHIMMELCKMNLQTFLLSDDRKNIKYNIKLFIDICLAIEYIHNNDIIHSDVNTGNILLDNNNNIKICDFGLSKKLTDENIIDNGSYGNILYMSPEQINDNICTKQSDIYSLGLVLIELLYKFTTVTHHSLVISKIQKGDHSMLKKLGLKFENLIIGATNYDYNKRITIGELINELSISNL